MTEQWGPVSVWGYSLSCPARPRCRSDLEKCSAAVSSLRKSNSPIPGEEHTLVVNIMVWGFLSLAVCWSLIRPQMNAMFFFEFGLVFFRWINAASSLHLFSIQGACLSQFGDFRHSWGCSLCYSSGGTQRPRSHSVFVSGTILHGSV